MDTAEMHALDLRWATSALFGLGRTEFTSSVSSCTCPLHALYVCNTIRNALSALASATSEDSNPYI